MKYLFAFFILCSTAGAEIVTVPFSVTATGVHGRPFGIQAVPFETIVSGSFAYETLTPPTQLATYGANFGTAIPNGFVMNIGGVSITSWSYDVLLRDEIPEAVGEIFGIQANDDQNGHDFRVNGVPAQGDAEFFYTTPDSTLFTGIEDARMLPSQSRLDQIDLVIMRGHLHDNLGNSILFIRVPEPSVIVFLSQTVLSVAAIRNRRVAKEIIA